MCLSARTLAPAQEEFETSLSELATLVDLSHLPTRLGFFAIFSASVELEEMKKTVLKLIGVVLFDCLLFAPFISMVGVMFPLWLESYLCYGS